MDASTFWFNVASTPGVGAAAFQKIWTRVHEQSIPLGSIVQPDMGELSSLLGVTSSIARNLAASLSSPRATPVAGATYRLLIAGSDSYPSSRLTHAIPPLPPILWARGDITLLQGAPTIGISGSRDATDDALEIARCIGEGASRAGTVVVSGTAAGVDTAAHRGALVGRAGTVGVIASGIARHRGPLTPRGNEPFCLVSEFPPDVEWTGRNAMQRNSTIAALSDRVVIVAAGQSGGTWEMARLCAKRGKPLFVFDLEERIAPGNRTLIKSLGATPVSPSEIERCWLEPVGLTPGGEPRTPLASRR